MSFLDALSFGPKITYPGTKPVGEPSIYASPEEWAAYRRQQAIVRDSNKMTPQEMESAAMLDLLAKSIGGGRGTVNPESVDPSAPAPSMEGSAGAGRGSVNPASVVPMESMQEAQEASILGQAFPEIFRKNPPKDTPDTTFGVEKVNARTAEHGVTAIRKDGKIYMTNINADGSINKGTGSPNSLTGNGMGTAAQAVPSKSMPNVSGDISSTLDQLKATDDYSKARGLVGNLVTSISAQRASMEQNAIQIAATKFGIPQLEAELQKSIQADMDDPKWYPGIGDSPITARLRGEIGQANIQSRQYAETYLKSNTSYASLGAYEKVAQLEFDRIKSATDRKDRLEDTSRDKRESIRLQQKMKAEDEIAVLTPNQLQRMVILNPALGQTDEDGQINPIPIASFMRNQKVLEAVTADPTNLTLYAMERNPYARALVSRMESGTMTEQQVEAKLEELVKKANSPQFTDQYAEFKFAGQKEAKQAYITAKTGAKVSTDAAGKAEYRRQILLEALEMEKAMQTGYALNDITMILPRDGIYSAAIAEALKVTGNTSLENVALALLKGASSSADRTAKKMMLAQDIQTALQKRPPSVFGAPDGNKLQQAVIEMTRTPWDKTRDVLTTPVAIPPFAPIFGLATGMAQQYMSEK